MILEAILSLIKVLLSFCFGWINLPQAPETITTSISQFLDLVFNNITLLGFFVRPITFQIAIPLLIIIMNFERLYKLTMWILRKIPMLSIK